MKHSDIIAIPLKLVNESEVMKPEKSQNSIALHVIIWLRRWNSLADMAI